MLVAEERRWPAQAAAAAHSTYGGEAGQLRAAAAELLPALCLSGWWLPLLTPCSPWCVDGVAVVLTKLGYGNGCTGTFVLSLSLPLFSCI